jgi:hypothetical protein
VIDVRIAVHVAVVVEVAMHSLTARYAALQCALRTELKPGIARIGGGAEVVVRAGQVDAAIRKRIEGLAPACTRCSDTLPQPVWGKIS